MLANIFIKNFTIIDTLDLELQAGLTVITGETGAGKSIMLDALQLALGDRVDGKVIRHGTDRCEISLTLDISAIPAARQWLVNEQLDSDGECVVRRTISADGRSRSTINGQPCPLQQIRQLGELLVNIHSQHAHHALLKSDQQRTLLDSFAKHVALCTEVSKRYKQWRQVQSQLDNLQVNDRDARLDLLRYQVQELDDLSITKEEFLQLEQEHKQLANADQLISKCQQALDIMENCNLHQALQQLDHIKKIDDKLNTETVNQATIYLDEATAELHNYFDNLENDPEHLNTIEQRLSRAHDLARKHRIEPETLPDIHQQLSEELSRLENADAAVEALQKQLAQTEKAYQQAAKKLTDSRNKAAKQFAEQVSQHMHTLGMPGGKLAIELVPHAETKPNLHGAENIHFVVSANPGQPLAPLNKVASGGELSRISLAIQVIAAQQQTTPTLIFDEVDVGIGGGTAEIVGKLLRTLGKKSQVLCVTHLAQVAAQGHQHLQVAKKTDGHSTITTLTALNNEQKTQEIARMLGGVKVTEQTLAHAREMLSLSD